jgi:hypothetical protein
MDYNSWYDRKHKGKSIATWQCDWSITLLLPLLNIRFGGLRGINISSHKDTSIYETSQVGFCILTERGKKVAEKLKNKPFDNFIFLKNKNTTNII